MSNALECRISATKPYHKIHMFKIVQQLVTNWYFVVVVRHKELEQHTTAGTKFKFTITIFKFSSVSVLFSNVCS